MQSDPPPTLDYAKPQEPESSSSGKVIAGFLGGWFLGIFLTGILADIFTYAIYGQGHDGGMYCIAAAAILIEAPLLAGLRALLGSRINGFVAFAFGLLCGPVILALMIIIG